MKLFSARLVDAKIFKQAPKGMLYLIESISFTSSQALSSQVYVIARKTDSSVTDVISNQDDVIASFAADIDGANFWVGQINEETKYITYSKGSTSSVSVVITCYGKLIPASTTRLIIEWIRRGLVRGR